MKVNDSHNAPTKIKKKKAVVFKDNIDESNNVNLTNNNRYLIPIPNEKSKIKGILIKKEKKNFKQDILSSKLQNSSSKKSDSDSFCDSDDNDEYRSLSSSPIINLNSTDEIIKGKLSTIDSSPIMNIISSQQQKSQKSEEFAQLSNPKLLSSPQESLFHYRSMDNLLPRIYPIDVPNNHGMSLFESYKMNRANNNINFISIKNLNQSVIFKSNNGDIDNTVKLPLILTIRNNTNESTNNLLKKGHDKMQNLWNQRKNETYNVNNTSQIIKDRSPNLSKMSLVNDMSLMNSVIFPDNSGFTEKKSSEFSKLKQSSFISSELTLLAIKKTHEELPKMNDNSIQLPPLIKKSPFNTKLTQIDQINNHIFTSPLNHKGNIGRDIVNPHLLGTGGQFLRTPIQPKILTKTSPVYKLSDIQKEAFLTTKRNEFLTCLNKHIFKYDIEAGTWSQYDLSNQIKTECFAFCSLNGDALMITGGIDIQKIIKISFKSMIFDTNIEKVINIADMNISRYNHSMINSNKEIYVIGGVGENDQILKYVEKYDNSANKWIILSMMKTPRVNPYLAFCYKSNQIFAYGGYDLDNQPIISIEVYDIKTDKWSLLEIPSDFKSSFGNIYKVVSLVEIDNFDWALKSENHILILKQEEEFKEGEIMNITEEKTTNTNLLHSKINEESLITEINKSAIKTEENMINKEINEDEPSLKLESSISQQSSIMRKTQNELNIQKENEPSKTIEELETSKTNGIAELSKTIREGEVSKIDEEALATNEKTDMTSQGQDDTTKNNATIDKSLNTLNNNTNLIYKRSKFIGATYNLITKSFALDTYDFYKVSTIKYLFEHNNILYIFGSRGFGSCKTFNIYKKSWGTKEFNKV